MKRDAVVPRFVVTEELTEGSSVIVGEDAARHMRALRVGAGAQVTLLDGAGRRAQCVLRSLAKRNATVEIEGVELAPSLPPVHALVPIADRERMLLLAGKCAELGLTSWRPVMWKRSRSVNPRGEGSGFQSKVRARMAASLEQSGNAWMPVAYPDTTIDRAIASLPEGPRYVMSPDGAPVAWLYRTALSGPVTFAIGPEGGFDDSELETLLTGGFVALSLASTVLRFETAGLAALAHVRAALAEQENPGE